MTSRIPEKAGDFLPVKKVVVHGETAKHTSVENLISGNGMSGANSTSATHETNVTGEHMWLAKVKDDELHLTFDFGGTYPIGEMWVWNYNQQHPENDTFLKKGIRKIKIYYSIDRKNWTELKGEGYPYELSQADGSSELKATNLNDGKNSPIRFGHVLARYVRITVDPTPGIGNWEEDKDGDAFFGLSAVCFFVGKGLAAIPAEEWTNLFHREKEWTGADGIYSVATDGRDQPVQDNSGETIFIFGDTFIGTVDSKTKERVTHDMINNTIGILKGTEPKEEAISFHWRETEDGKPASMYYPTTPKGKSVDESYYWLQDGISFDGHFYCMPMIVGPNPDGPEGFEFEIHGVTCIQTPIGENGLEIEKQKQVDTPLYYIANNGKRTYFGAGFMADTEEAGVPSPSGYIYIYGLQKWDLLTKLVVARVKKEHFLDYTKWEYWAGTEWSKDLKEAQPIAHEVSSELSVSYMDEGFLKGKYIVAYQKMSGEREIAIYVGESPVGPFEESVDLFYCHEHEAGNGIYVYNAKGHPHLSKPGELLVSYNVNTTSWEMHEKDGSIYRPHFLTIRQYK